MGSTSTNSNLSKRRRFQPPITSFFASTGSFTTDNKNGLSHDNYSSPTHTPTPALPAKIQSSLLTVGMRVRKSVPEGYKTEQTKLTTFSSYGLKSISDSSSSTIYSQSERAYAELLPFSGLHRVGNHAVQTFPRLPVEYQDNDQSKNSYAMTDDGDIFSLPSSTQESNVSSIFSANSNKRSYESDGEDEWVDEIVESPSHPAYSGAIWQDPLRSNPVLRNSFYTTPTSTRPIRRPILSPKTSQQRQQYFPSVYQQSSSSAKHVIEQENTGPETSKVFAVIPDMEMEDLDFGEAVFLRHPKEVDYKHRSWGGEVEMGG
jgi:hypothetical protein